MSPRPLLITDCDEVLLHFVTPFAAYLESAHDLTLHLDSFALSGNIRRADGSTLEPSAFMPLLEGFFETQMPMQTPAPGAVDVLATLARTADIVILTNVDQRHHAPRTAELARLGMPYRVVTNSGGKGQPVANLVAEYNPSAAVFVDDLPPHHSSVKAHAPSVYRLHMVAEPKLRALIPAAPDADARIDDWPTALRQIQSVFAASERRVDRFAGLRGAA